MPRICGCWRTLPWRRNTGRIGKAGGWNQGPMRARSPGGEGRGGVAGTDWAASSGARFDPRRGTDAFEAADQIGTAFSESRSQTDPAYKPAVKESLDKFRISLSQPIQQQLTNGDIGNRFDIFPVLYASRHIEQALIYRHRLSKFPSPTHPSAKIHKCDASRQRFVYSSIFSQFSRSSARQPAASRAIRVRMRSSRVAWLRCSLRRIHACG
jgi:hypothetical protein